MKNFINRSETALLFALLIVAIASIFMFRLGWTMGENSYAIKDDTIYTKEDLSASYNQGFNDGLLEAEEATMATHYEILDAWFSDIQNVTDNNGTIKITDENGNLWILVVDDFGKEVG